MGEEERKKTSGPYCYSDVVAEVIDSLYKAPKTHQIRVLNAVAAYYELDEDEECDCEDDSCEVDATSDDPRSTHTKALVHLYRDVEDEEEVALRRLCHRFSFFMLQKMIHKKRTDGYYGWEEKTTDNAKGLRDGIENHWERDDRYEISNLIDLANFCAFLWNLEREA